MTSFTLSPEFMNVSSRLGITIPFEEIDRETYSDNVSNILKQRIRLEAESVGKREIK